MGDNKQFYKRLGNDILRLTIGCTVYVIGYNGFASVQNFVPSGTMGLAFVIKNFLPFDISIAIPYLCINIPLFILAKRNVSIKFLLLNLYSMLLITVLLFAVGIRVVIDDTILAALAAGAVMGAGSGIILSSTGGGGGFDVLAVILHKKHGIRLGAFFMTVNTAIMLLAATQVSIDKLIASILMAFVTSVVLEKTLSAFDQRKEVQVISKYHAEIGEKLLEAHLSGTAFTGKGLYSKEPVTMIMLVINNFQYKLVENIVFDIDPDALIITDNSFSVVGKTIAPRKKY